MTKKINIDDQTLKKFIQVFFSKGQRNRRSFNNSLQKTTAVLNKVFKKYYKINYCFEKHQVFKCFFDEGYNCLNTTDDEFTWEGSHLGSVLGSTHIFIITEPQNLKDLNIACGNKIGENWNIETQERIIALKDQLQSFAKTLT